MYSYYFKFGLINTENILLYKLKLQIPLNTISNIRVENKYNNLLKTSFFVLYTLLVLIVCLFENYFFLEFLSLLSVTFIILFTKLRGIYYVVFDTDEMGKLSIPIFFISKKKAIRFSRRLNNKIDYLKNKDFSFFIFN